MKFVSILMLLFIVTPSFAGGKSLSLLQGSPAPFTGYLIDQEKADSIRDITIDRDSGKKINELLSQENVLLSQRLSNSHQENDILAKRLAEARSDSTFNKIGYFILGALVTTGIAYGVAQTIK